MKFRMSSTRSWVTGTVLLASLVPQGMEAQSLGDRLRQGADAVKEGAAGIAGKAEDSVGSTVDLFMDKGTPQETRAALDAMAAETLAELFAGQPDALTLYAQSAGHAVFDSRRLVIAGVAAGGGRGVAVPHDGSAPTYMNMGTAGVGLSFGIGGFDTQVVILFEDAANYRDFVTNGYDATAEAGSMFGDQEATAGFRFVDGRAIFQVSDSGWKLSGTATGTRYWPDPDLN
jgi:lipid-binding SYLF domain-containing protein